MNYKKRAEIWMDINKIEATEKVRTFLAIIDPTEFEPLVNLCIPEEVDSKTYEHLTKLCDAYYKTVRTEEGERDVFRTCKQKPNQSIADYVLELKKMSRYCNYGTNLKEALKKTFYMGTTKQVH